jgi:ParB-like chromosome segregation protein Spo0J
MPTKSSTAVVDADVPPPKRQEQAASIKTLHSDPDNPRQISSRALAGLGTSTSKFGDLSGIVFNKRTGCLVAGHQRVKVLRQAGAKVWVTESETQGYILHPESGHRFNVRIVDWDEVTERAANLTANNPEISGTYTDEAIGQLVALERELADFEDLELGLLEKDLRKQFKLLEETTTDVGDEDEPEIHEKFLVLVECISDTAQASLIERLLKEGFTVRAMNA